jgi:hypothetical protein
MIRWAKNLIRHCHTMKRHDEFCRTGEDLLDSLGTALIRFAASSDDEKFKAMFDPALTTFLAIIDLCPKTSNSMIQLSLEKSDLTVVSVVITNGDTGESFNFSLSGFQVMQRTISHGHEAMSGISYIKY